MTVFAIVYVHLYLHIRIVCRILDTIMNSFLPDCFFGMRNVEFGSPRIRFGSYIHML